MNRSLLFLTVLVIATCGLIDELIVGTLASYLLGDSITQFSTVIGVYLFALGIGAWLSGFIDKGLASSPPSSFTRVGVDHAYRGSSRRHTSRPVALSSASTSPFSGPGPTRKPASPHLSVH